MTQEEYDRATCGPFCRDYDWRFPNIGLHGNDLLQTVAEPLINQWLVIRKMIEQRENPDFEGDPYQDWLIDRDDRSCP